MTQLYRYFNYRPTAARFCLINKNETFFSIDVSLGSWSIDFGGLFFFYKFHNS